MKISVPYAALSIKNNIKKAQASNEAHAFLKGVLNIQLLVPRY